jgi:WD40 repeat protein
MRYLLTLICLFTPLAIFAQDKKPDAIPVVSIDRKEPVDYNKDIEPIFAAKCTVCHSGNILEGKLDMSSFAALMKGGKSGNVVLPGKANESLLIRMAGRTKKPYMPPKGDEPFTPQELALVTLWVNQGAKAPTGAREKPKVALTLPASLVKPVRGLAITPDKTLVAASRGNQIHLYDAKTGNHVRSLSDPKVVGSAGKPANVAHVALVEALTFTPDGKSLISGSFQELCIWNPADGQLTAKVTGFADRVMALALSPDGKMLATGGGAATEDGEIKLLELPSGKVLHEIKNGHSDTVLGVNFSPDGKLLATCGADKFVKVWDVPAGKFVKSFEGHTNHVLDVGWAPNGKLLASAGADSVVKIWDYEKGEKARDLKNHAGQVTRLVFVGKQPQFLTCGGDRTVKSWNPDNGGMGKQYAGQSADFLYALAASPDGALVAAGGEEGIVWLYNGTDGKLIKALTPPQ